jgi:hypothetical protein
VVVSDIAGNTQYATGFGPGAELGHCTIHSALFAAGHDHIASPRQELTGEAAADATRAAGDHYGTIFHQFLYSPLDGSVHHVTSCNGDHRSPVRLSS